MRWTSRKFRVAAAVTAAAIGLTMSPAVMASTPQFSTSVSAIQGTWQVGSAIELDLATVNHGRSGSYLLDTEVWSNGVKVAQSVEPSVSIARGAAHTSVFNWNTYGLPAGKFQIRSGVYSLNWGHNIVWNNDVKTIGLGASQWNLSSSATQNGDGTLSVGGNFVVPAGVDGDNQFDLEFLTASPRQKLEQATKETTITPGTSLNLGLKTDKLADGIYEVGQGVWTSDWSRRKAWWDTAQVTVTNGVATFRTLGAPSVIAIAPTPTSTTLVTPTTIVSGTGNSPTPTSMPATTTTTVPATTTTVKPTTTTTTKPTTTTTVPATTTTTTAPANGAGNLPGWNLEYSQDFNTNAASGSFLSTYKDFSAYGTGWLDTSKNGTYNQNNLSVSNGSLAIACRTQGGKPGCAVPEPLVNNGKADQLYGRYEVRFKADQIAGYKTAFLLWPQSDVWNDGEIDFPEGNLNSTIGSFSHCVGNPSSNCAAFGSNSTYANWHDAVIEWSPGKVSFYLDGTLLGSTTKSTPSVPMHWVLQTETQLSGGAPSSSASGSVYIDYVRAWSYAG